MVLKTNVFHVKSDVEIHVAYHHQKKSGNIGGLSGLYTLPETNIAPENGGLEDGCFLLGRPIFRGYVSSQEGT